jgi:hypothetical protein
LALFNKASSMVVVIFALTLSPLPTVKAFIPQ